MAILPSDPAEQKRLLLGVLPIVLLFAYWYFYHGKLTEQITVQETRLERLETTNAAAQALVAKAGPELEQRLVLYEEHMERLERLIPRGNEVPQLLNDITIRAQETGVDLVLMRPQPAQAGEYYTLQTYELTMQGAYHDVGSFLTAIGSLPRIVTPVDLRLSLSGEQDGQGGVDLDASFRIQTYVLPSNAPTTEAVSDART